MKIPFKKDKPEKKKLDKQQEISKGFRELTEYLKKYLQPHKDHENILILAFLVLIVSLSTLFLLSSFNESHADNSTSSKAPSAILAKTNDSYVIKEGPYGNTTSNVTIAYIVGVHPRESSAHHAIIEAVRESDSSLEKEYYLYIINAPLYGDNYPQERLNGQLLAKNYVVPDIINNSYQLAVDVHSSNGSYSVNRFVFAPIQETKSITISRELRNKISWLKYYYPRDPSSTEYVTIPLIKAGIPSIVYETYKYDSNTTTREHAQEFLEVIDKSQLFI